MRAAAWALAGACTLVAALGAASRISDCSLAVNLTGSLPQRLWLIEHRCTPAKGGYAAFAWPDGGALPRGITLIKRVAGVAGERIERRGDTLCVAGVPIGRLLEKDSRGRPLAATAAGTIPAGFWFAAAPHPRSLDSRYSPPGLVALAATLGCARPLL